MTPANERKAAERKRKREAGLVPLEVWVPPQMVDTLRLFVDQRVKIYALTKTPPKAPDKDA